MSNFAKAIAAAVGAAGAGILTAAADGGIAANEWWTIFGGVLVTTAGVYCVPNQP